jgi:acyl carrier protein
MKEKILPIIYAALKDAGQELGKPELSSPDPETRLYGRSGHLDSLALVNLLADVEQRVADDLGKAIVLADERAMSQKRSPFATAGTLADYIEILLSEG